MEQKISGGEVRCTKISESDQVRLKLTVFRGHRTTIYSALTALELNTEIQISESITL